MLSVRSSFCLRPDVASHTCHRKHFSTCLNEKPARAGKLPTLAPALLRQLAGMGNNLNQIARRVNAGGGSGHDRVQVVAALMAIDAGLERLRHAVLEKRRDDDR
ncbi:MobC family plasmid mobilization relaxosome protein (plasmid) [Enterobacter sp. JBIWA005]|nr:MobC family plasmid mobilization relaxosome protein [Enterobacter sp. JBIWA005]